MESQPQEYTTRVSRKVQGHTPRGHCYPDRDQSLPWNPGRARRIRSSPHLPQLLACCLVLSPLTQVLHTLILGQEVLLLGVHFVTLSLVEQFAEGDAGLVGLGGVLGQLVLAYAAAPT